ncbi:MAG: hypothetical protein NTV36_03335, partial [Candidatus Staskawiczbacteria bacterium]|nr:hypothetical protein [Candidatus Staskawiczbacteria bacterium]
MIDLKKIKFLFFLPVLFFLLAYGISVFSEENVIGASGAGTINAVSENASNRIAPGEFLPISVKLVNFGSIKRVDVIVDYKILDNNNTEVYAENETVAVETTASFVKRIQVPSDIKPGKYTFITVLKYPYQEQPAVSKFTFLVETKFAGFFKTDLIIFSIIVVVLASAIFAFAYFFARRNQKNQIAFHDYSNKAKDQIIYYEILSDIISQMRLRIGNDAFEIAKDIPDLEVDDRN